MGLVCYTFGQNGKTEISPVFFDFVWKTDATELRLPIEKYLKRFFKKQELKMKGVGKAGERLNKGNLSREKIC